jgi:hypothetical protein
VWGFGEWNGELSLWGDGFVASCLMSRGRAACL